MKVLGLQNSFSIIPCCFDLRLQVSWIKGAWSTDLFNNEPGPGQLSDGSSQVSGFHTWNHSDSSAVTQGQDHFPTLVRLLRSKTAWNSGKVFWSIVPCSNLLYISTVIACFFICCSCCRPFRLFDILDLYVGLDSWCWISKCWILGILDLGMMWNLEFLDVEFSRCWIYIFWNFGVWEFWWILGWCGIWNFWIWNFLDVGVLYYGIWDFWILGTLDLGVICSWFTNDINIPSTGCQRYFLAIDSLTVLTKSIATVWFLWFLRIPVGRVTCVTEAFLLVMEHSSNRMSNVLYSQWRFYKIKNDYVVKNQTCLFAFPPAQPWEWSSCGPVVEQMPRENCVTSLRQRRNRSRKMFVQPS